MKNDSSDWKYSICDDEAQIEGGPTCGDVIIPDKLENCPVTSIEDGAFANCEDLTSVVIPEGVTRIEEGAFSGCSGLVTVSLPSTIQYIGDYAFCNCGGLTSMQLPLGLTEIGSDAFSDCYALKTMDIPSSLTAISPEAFQSSGLESVRIPPSVTFIGEDAFDDCNDLKTVYVNAGNEERIMRLLKDSGLSLKKLSLVAGSGGDKAESAKKEKKSKTGKKAKGDPKGTSATKEKSHDIAIILRSDHYTIFRSDKTYARPIDEMSDGYFASGPSSFHIVELPEKIDFDDDDQKYFAIVNAGEQDNDSDESRYGEDAWKWMHSIKRKSVKPKIELGDDIASVKTMGKEKKCEYAVSLDEGVPEYICELTIRGAFDRKKFSIEVGDLYLPDAEWCDENGCIKAIRSVKYNGEVLNFWCSEWVGMPGNGWSTDADWYYVIENGVTQKVAVNDHGEPQWPK